MPLPPAPPPPPSADAALLGQMPTPEQEQWLLQRLKLGQGMVDRAPMTNAQGAGPGAAWGLADAARTILGTKYQNDAMAGLRDLGRQRVAGRQKIFDLMQPQPQREGMGGDGVPDSIRRPGTADTSGPDRMRRAMQLAAVSGDPGLEKLTDMQMKQQQQDREYAVLAHQVEQQNRQFGLEERKVGDTEKQQEFERGHVSRTEQEWTTTPLPEQGGFMSTSKHTGEAWFYQPGKAPVRVVEGTAPGGSRGPPPLTGAPDLGRADVPPDPHLPGSSAQPARGGTREPAPDGGVGAGAQEASAWKPYVKMNEGTAQTDLRVASGIKGLKDAMAPGFPSTGLLSGTVEGARWRAAEHGASQLATPDQQHRVSSWDAVVDPIIRARAGARVPEESMGRMRLELRPNPGESWDVHVSKVHRMLDTMRAEAQQLPPVKGGPYLQQLDDLERAIPKTKAEYDAFNKQAQAASKAYRRGGPLVPQAGGSAPASPGAPLRPKAKPALKDQLDEVYR